MTPGRKRKAGLSRRARSSCIGGAHPACVPAATPADPQIGHDSAALRQRATFAIKKLFSLAFPHTAITVPLSPGKRRGSACRRRQKLHLLLK